jgi:hypothetical protein
MTENTPETTIEGNVENVNVEAPQPETTESTDETVKGNDDPAEDYATKNNGNPE